MPEQTCGQGLAEHSVLPAKIAQLIDALAENLELHMTALDLEDENSRKENKVYHDLASKHRKIAEALQDIASRMAGYHDLPMGRHDMTAMMDPKIRTAFETFVKLEQELSRLLEQRIVEDRKLLAQMQHE